MTATLEASERPTAATTQRSARRRRRLREAGLAYALLVPAGVIFAGFIFYPFLKNFDLALHSTNPFNPDLST